MDAIRQVLHEVMRDNLINTGIAPRPRLREVRNLIARRADVHVDETGFQIVAAPKIQAQQGNSFASMRRQFEPWNFSLVVFPCARAIMRSPASSV